MKRHDEIKLEFTREWAQKAESDFRAAQYLLEALEDHAYGVAFHAQQAAEKYLKALLVWHQIEFKKTHDIEVLLGLADAAASGISETLAEATALTPYGAEYRYPGDYPEATRADAERALDLATLVRAEIRNRLPEHVLE